MTSTAKALFVLRTTPSRAEGSVSCTPRPQAAELTRRLADGEESAFEEFHAKYFDRLHQFLLVVARGREHEAEEALQETFLRVVKHARVFEDEEAFWCWLKAVARSAARDAGRKRSRYAALLERFSFLWRQEGTPDDHGEERRLEEVSLEALAELSEDERELVQRKYVDGESVKEIALRLSVSEKAVESRLTRARTRLRARILRKLQEP